MPSRITRKIEFDYGHRVLGHLGKCSSLHGHRGVAEITVEAPELDHLGMVVDFSVIKDVVGKWVDSTWDHTMLLNKRDPLFQIDIIPACDRELIFGKRQPYIMDCNPTAENMARELGEKAKQLLQSVNSNLRVVLIRLYETPNSYAEYRPL